MKPAADAAAGASGRPTRLARPTDWRPPVCLSVSRRRAVQASLPAHRSMISLSLLTAVGRRRRAVPAAGPRATRAAPLHRPSHVAAAAAAAVFVVTAAAAAVSVTDTL